MNELGEKILLAIITAFFVYFFAIRGKKYDFNNEKKKIINKILSDLLEVKLYVDMLNQHFDLIQEDESNSIFPKDKLLDSLNSSKKLNPNCFENAEKSISELKTYDPDLYIKISGLGNMFNEIINEPKYKYVRETVNIDRTQNHLYSIFLEGINHSIDWAIAELRNQSPINKIYFKLFSKHKLKAEKMKSSMEDSTKFFIEEFIKANNISIDNQSISDSEKSKLLEIRNLLNQNFDDIDLKKLTELRKIYPKKTEAEIIEMIRNNTSENM